MEIKFGLYLDGQKCSPPGDALGKETVGPLGFLAILETFLGLTSEPVRHSLRVMHYQEALREACCKPRFYSRSLNVDELGTASQLLMWRDLWFLHGWNGTMDSTVSSRLLDLSEVETFLKGRLAPSIGERLLVIEEMLGQRKTPIKQVILVDDLLSFPYRWQRVLANLPLRELSPETSVPCCSEGKFLGQLQRALLAVTQNHEVEAIDYVADGSFTVVEADTAITSAQWLSVQANPLSTLLIAPTAGDVLDEFIESAG